LIPTALMMLITENALPSGLVTTVPRAALSERTEEFIDPACVPVNLQTWNPAEMDLSDVYQLYEHIISSQESPDGTQFKFILNNKILASLAPDPLPPTSSPTQSTMGSPAPSKLKLGQKWKLEDNVAIIAKVSKNGKQGELSILPCTHSDWLN